jgi:hypothetical protein
VATFALVARTAGDPAALLAAAARGAEGGRAVGARSSGCPRWTTTIGGTLAKGARGHGAARRVLLIAVVLATLGVYAMVASP